MCYKPNRAGAKGSSPKGAQPKHAKSCKQGKCMALSISKSWMVLCISWDATHRQKMLTNLCMATNKVDMQPFIHCIFFEVLE